MRHLTLRPQSLFVIVFFSLLLFSILPAMAADGKKWDGKAYPFKALNPAQPNSESNPFIIDTAGKLAYLSSFSRIEDMVGFAEKNGLLGFNDFFKNNYVKLTADLDMNGSLYEFIAIDDTWMNFDGGGHVITNLRISDKKTEPYINPLEGLCYFQLALFRNLETVKNLKIGKGSTIIYNRNNYTSKTGTMYVTVFLGAVAVTANIIEDCSSEATITAKGTCDGLIGGVVAESFYKMINSHFDGNIITDVNIINGPKANFTGKVEPGKLQVGGVCAISSFSFDPQLRHSGITNCYNTGTINVKASGKLVLMGGIAASIVGAGRCECTDIYNAGKMNLSSDGDIKTAYVGGVLGLGNTTEAIPFSKPIKYINTGKIYNTGNIAVAVKTGEKMCVGGIGGGEESLKIIQYGYYNIGGNEGFVSTYNTGSITVSSTDKVDALNVGGIVGCGRKVFNSYNTGNINGTSVAGTTINAGGIGGSSVYAQNCYSTGAINIKGTGKNVAGGVIGLADLNWGEVKDHCTSVTNVFWLKQQQPDGINTNIAYGRGSYSYSMKNGKMVENDQFGTIYSFEDPTATSMARSDDGSGKRSGYTGSLLQALNELVAQRADRNFRKWKVDGTNGGYPVFEEEK